MAWKTWSAFSVFLLGFGACTTQSTRGDDDDGSMGGSKAGAPAGGGGNPGAAGEMSEAGAPSSSGRAAGGSGGVPAGGRDSGQAGDGQAGDGQAGDAGEGGVGRESCSGVEAAPNDTREDSTPYTLNSTYVGCLQSGEDIDFYEFTTPAAGDGGYVVVKLTDVATTGNVSIELWSGADNGAFGSSYSVTRGASVYAYFNAEPGATFRVSVEPFSSNVDATQYSLLAEYHPVLDTHEPNDVRTMATPIALGEAVEGYLFAGWKSSTSIPEEAWHDWYSLDLAVGASRAVLSILASDINGSIRLYNSLGSEVEHAYSVTQGSSVQLDYTVATAGKYYLRVGYFTGPNTEGNIVEVPHYLTEPYTLTVTQ